MWRQGGLGPQIRNKLKTTRQRQKYAARVHGTVCRGVVLAVPVTHMIPDLPSWRQVGPTPMLWGNPPSSAPALAFPGIIQRALSTLRGSLPWSDVGASAGGACRSLVSDLAVHHLGSSYEQELKQWLKTLIFNPSRSTSISYWSLTWCFSHFYFPATGSTWHLWWFVMSGLRHLGRNQEDIWELVSDNLPCARRRVLCGAGNVLWEPVTDPTCDTSSSPTLCFAQTLLFLS